LYRSFCLYKENPHLIKTFYFDNLKDYFIASVLVVLAIILSVFFYYLKMPKWLTFSWLKLIDQSSTNLILSSIFITAKYTNSKILIFLISSLIYTLLVFAMPYLVHQEELIFRDCTFDTKSRIIKSLKFGFSHMIVGVPVFVAIILSIYGYLFSIRYVKSFLKKFSADGKNFMGACEFALNQSSSLHSKYNFIIISICFILLLFS